jgi:hypothetical protein
MFILNHLHHLSEILGANDPEKSGDFSADGSIIQRWRSDRVGSDPLDPGRTKASGRVKGKDKIQTPKRVLVVDDDLISNSVRGFRVS